MTSGYPNYPEIPDGKHSWSHVGSDAEAANIYVGNIPVVFYDRLDNRYTVFQKFPAQRPINNSLMIDELTIGRVFIVYYEGRKSRIIPDRMHEYQLNAGSPIIIATRTLGTRRSLVKWYMQHGRQKPRKSQES